MMMIINKIMKWIQPMKRNNYEDEGGDVDDEFNSNNEINEDVMESDNEDDVVGEDNEKPPYENEEGGNDNDEDEEPTAEGVEGANDIDTEDVDMDSAVKQELGEKGEGAIIKSWKKIMILELQELSLQWINNNNNKKLKKKKINLFKMMHVKKRMNH